MRLILALASYLHVSEATFLSSEIGQVDSKTVVITYSGAAPAAYEAGHSVTVNGVAATIASGSVSGRTIRLVLAAGVEGSDTVLVSCSGSANIANYTSREVTNTVIVLETYLGANLTADFDGANIYGADGDPVRILSSFTSGVANYSLLETGYTTKGTLTSPGVVNGTDQTILVTGTKPTTSTYICVDNEIMFVNSTDASSMNVNRAQFGTVGAAHTTGKTIYQTVGSTAAPTLRKTTNGCNGFSVASFDGLSSGGDILQAVNFQMSNLLTSNSWMIWMVLKVKAPGNSVSGIGSSEAPWNNSNGILGDNTTLLAGCNITPDNRIGWTNGAVGKSCLSDQRYPLNDYFLVRIRATGNGMCQRFWDRFYG